MKRKLFVILLCFFTIFAFTACGSSIAGSYVSSGDGLYYSDEWKEQLGKTNTLDYISDENEGDQVIILGDDGSFHYEAYGNSSDGTYSSEKETMVIDDVTFDCYNVYMSDDSEESSKPDYQFLVPEDPSLAHDADAILNMGGILTYLKKQ